MVVLSLVWGERLSAILTLRKTEARGPLYFCFRLRIGSA